MKRPTIALRSIPSSGPIEAREWDTGAYVDLSTPCPGCKGTIEKGEQIVKLGHSWFHLDCGKDHLTATDVQNAWVMIAMDMARSPRSYGVKEIRVVMEHLIQVAQWNLREDDDGADLAAVTS